MRTFVLLVLDKNVWHKLKMVLLHWETYHRAADRFLITTRSKSVDPLSKNVFFERGEGAAAHGSDNLCLVFVNELLVGP